MSKLKERFDHFGRQFVLDEIFNNSCCSKQNGFTSLVWVARSGDVEIVQLLLGGGANVNHKNHVSVSCTSLIPFSSLLEKKSSSSSSSSSSSATTSCRRCHLRVCVSILIPKTLIDKSH